MIRILAVSLTLAILATGCLFEPQEESGERGETPRVASGSGDCGKPRSVTDLSQEPDYSANYLHRWATAEGCPVRLDIIMTRHGPDACGGTKVADVLIGWPLGSAAEQPNPFRIFVRDPYNVFGDSRISRGFDNDAELPADAVDTGYRQWEAELWMRPHDDAFIYLVHEDRVERWPHDATPPVCA